MRPTLIIVITAGVVVLFQIFTTPPPTTRVTFLTPPTFALQVSVTHVTIASLGDACCLFVTFLLFAERTSSGIRALVRRIVPQAIRVRTYRFFRSMKGRSCELHCRYR